MPHYSFIRSIPLACMLTLLAGYATADVVKCMDKAGTVTYTDVSCKAGDSVRGPSASRGKNSSAAANSAAIEKNRNVALMKKSAGNHAFAIDVATLKEAKSSLVLMDEASSLLRQQKLAALDVKNQRWFSF